MFNQESRALRFAVIGAGSGGQAFAGYLAARGYCVNLYNRSIEKIKDIANQGYIELSGTITGKGRLNLVTTNLEKAVRNTDIIMVVLPASAHKEIASKLAPLVTEEQYVVLNPGRTGGALEFRNIFRKQNPFKQVTIIEAQTLLYACRCLAPGQVKIFSKKDQVKVAALPAYHTHDFLYLIRQVFPEFVGGDNVLDTSFNNVGAVLHPIPTILNCARIESTSGNFQYYIEGITPAVERVLLQVDQERLNVAKALGVHAISLMEWLKASYHAEGETLCDALKNHKGYWGIMAPPTMNNRYIFEDIPQSLVPIYDMGTHLGIQTPTIQAMIHLASTIHNTNYLKYGRKITDMGISHLSAVSEIREYVLTGEFNDTEERLVVL